MSITLNPGVAPRCATELISPQALSAQELDERLAQGWYRVGSRLIRCDFTSARGQTHGVVWTRVPLEGYTFGKSARRVRRRVEAACDVQITDVTLDEEHEALYHRYLTVAPGERSSTLYEFLHGPGGELGLFDTREVAVRDAQGRLVAFSWFDVGQAASQSLIGVFEPAWGAMSLGFYTMLREVQASVDWGLEYFYAGYVLVGDPAMDYKLRTGHVECLDRTCGRWSPLTPTSLAQLDPLGRTTQALERLGLRAQGWSWRRHEHHALASYAPHLAGCLAYPVALIRYAGPQLGLWAIAWDSVAQVYELMQCAAGSLASQEGVVLFEDLLFVVRSMGHYSEAALEARLEQLGLRQRAAW